jgi:hypothetical protein
VASHVEHRSLTFLKEITMQNQGHTAPEYAGRQQATTYQSNQYVPPAKGEDRDYDRSCAQLTQDVKDLALAGAALASALNAVNDMGEDTDDDVAKLRAEGEDFAGLMGTEIGRLEQEISKINYKLAQVQTKFKATATALLILGAAVKSLENQGDSK